MGPRSLRNTRIIAYSPGFGKREMRAFWLFTVVSRNVSLPCSGDFKNGRASLYELSNPGPHALTRSGVITMTGSVSSAIAWYWT